MEQPSPQTNKIVLILIGLILLSFIVGAYRVQLQAQQIGQIVDDQSPLIFAFENAVTGAGRITFVVTCTREEHESKYICVTKQTEPVVANLTPAPTPRTP